MCGVDVHDMQLYAYHDERRTVKVWKKVTFNIISRMLFNSYQLYVQNTNAPRPLSRRQFYSSVIESFSTDHLRALAIQPPPRGAVVQPRPLQAVENIQAGVRQLSDKREKDCVVCSRKNGNGRKRSRTECVVCKRGLHLICEKRHKH